MKLLYVSIACFLLAAFTGCSSTKEESASDRAWMQIQPGMTKEEVYTKLGQPFREADREGEWRHPEGHGWRVVVVSFDENGLVAVVRGEQRHQ